MKLNGDKQKCFGVQKEETRSDTNKVIVVVVVLVTR